MEYAPFHFTYFDYSLADLDSLFDHLRDISWKDIFELSVAVIEFCEWVQVVIDITRYCKYQIKPHSSPLFSTACAAATA